MPEFNSLHRAEVTEEWQFAIEMPAHLFLDKVFTGYEIGGLVLALTNQCEPTVREDSHAFVVSWSMLRLLYLELA